MFSFLRHYIHQCGEIVLDNTDGNLNIFNYVLI